MLLFVLMTTALSASVPPILPLDSVSWWHLWEKSIIALAQAKLATLLLPSRPGYSVSYRRPFPSASPQVLARLSMLLNFITMLQYLTMPLKELRSFYLVIICSSRLISSSYCRFT